MSRQPLTKNGVERLREELARLKKDLEGWSYKPNPVLRVEIPKPGKGAGVRLLGVPCIGDRVVHATLKILLEPILDPTFSDHSYGFREGRSAHQAVRTLEQAWKQKRHDVQPRLNRLEHGYPFLRAAMCVFMRDISTNIAVMDMMRGAASIYMLYLGYDEVAHHSGPWTEDAFGDLKRVAEWNYHADDLGMDWDYDLDRWSNPLTGESIGYFVFDYGGGTTAQRLVELVPDPV